MKSLCLISFATLMQLWTHQRHTLWDGWSSESEEPIHRDASVVSNPRTSDSMKRDKAAAWFQSTYIEVSCWSWRSRAYITPSRLPPQSLAWLWLFDVSGRRVAFCSLKAGSLRESKTKLVSPADTSSRNPDLELLAAALMASLLSAGWKSNFIAGNVALWEGWLKWFLKS